MVVEAWSGLAVLSSLFAEQGHSILGCVELNPVLMKLAAWMHRGSSVAGDFYDRLSLCLSHTLLYLCPRCCCTCSP